MKIIEGSITTPRGFLAAGVAANIRKKSRKDVGLLYSPQLCTAAGVFTTNVVHADSVDMDRKHLADGYAQAIVVNSGIANACNGEAGPLANRLSSEKVASLLGIAPENVLVASTGVIGVPLPLDKMAEGIELAAQNLHPDGGSEVALAIMTTDTTQKEAAIEMELNGKKVYLGAVAKGSGMIHPNMATMLGFITTDAAISPSCLQTALKEAVQGSFNMVSVDRDTSTNDSVLILANGMAENTEITDPSSADYAQFAEALSALCVILAKKIARDGEGATHLIQVTVEHAASLADARTIARSITASNLVKAAVFGRDANWGRILCAAGYAGVDFDPSRADVYLGDVMTAQNGMGLDFDEEAALNALSKDTVDIRVDLKAGDFQATAWGCDLTYDYVKINGDYRT